MRFVVALLLLVAGAARADDALDGALVRFQEGDYPAVMTLLKPLVDADLPKDPTDRAQALRVYGVACFMTNDKLAADGAFVKLLRLEPSAQLDPELVRPEVISRFNQLRHEHAAELLREVEHHRPRSAVLNLFPPAGQYQNGQRGKFYTLLALEVGLLAANLATGISLYTQRHADGTYDDPVRAQDLKAANWLSFAVVVSLAVYGIVDGFVVHHRIMRDLARDEDSLLHARATPTGVKLRASAEGVGLAF